MKDVCTSPNKYVCSLFDSCTPATGSANELEASDADDGIMGNDINLVVGENCSVGCSWPENTSGVAWIIFDISSDGMMLEKLVKEDISPGAG